MFVSDVKSYIDSIYSPILSVVSIYKNTSIYCEYKYKGERLVFSFNSDSCKFFIYHRSKSSYNYLFDLFSKYNFTDTGTVSFKQQQRLDVKEVAILFKAIAADIEKTLVENNIKKLDMHEIYDTHRKFLISGNSFDKNNNIIEAQLNQSNCSVIFKGKNNKVQINSPLCLKNTIIEFIGDNSSITIGEGVKVGGYYRLGSQCHIVINNNVTSTSAISLVCAETTSISIGEDCMLASGISIRTDDAHAIYDVKTKLRLNPSKNIKIGNHVWIANNVTILGGAIIADGCVVGIHSLVKKEFPNNCIIAGIPAKVIRKDVFWERPYVPSFNEPKSWISEEEITLSYCNETYDQ